MSSRALAAVAVAGQLAFVAAWVVGGLAQEGYSTAAQTVSELFSRTADHPWILWIGLAALAPSYLATATLLHRMLGPRGRPAAALFVLASALVLTVLFSPLDCMTNGDPTCGARVDAGEVSAAHSRHNTAAVTLQLCLVATAFLVAFALRGRRAATGWWGSGWSGSPRWPGSPYPGRARATTGSLSAPRSAS
ncbi:MAG: DUF998 domain-containing protein [Thermoleophilaceae bacterium]